MSTGMLAKAQQERRNGHGSSYEGIDQEGSYMGMLPFGKGGIDGAGSAHDKRKKRIRRTANQINRRFICMCGKAYGSEGSLNQHKKNKGHFGEPRLGPDSMHGGARHPDIADSAMMQHEASNSNSREHTDSNYR
mmetsp:Transcript_35859/g.47186  ORF Transcript_35859/g.47186 Transcript_35859/m.47186 type:complete len:134 (-) Transcript_35859:62-463(-)